MAHRSIAESGAVWLWMLRLSVGCLCSQVVASALAADGLELPAAAERQVDFARDIYPLLKTHCFRCHQGRASEAGHRLDQRAELLGETGGEPLIVPGRSADSRLVRLVSGKLGDDERMPPRGKGELLSAADVALLRAWIDQGAAWDDELLPSERPKQHWAFQKIIAPPVSATAGGTWARNAVDRFIAARHESIGLHPAREASPRQLARRAALDLTGLPPSAAELDAFEADAAPDAYERWIERLLASPHYGERWGRHWLDVARFAESEGYESNHPRPFAWRYRDYVVASFNCDKPFDQFLREQIAGDELAPYSDEQLIATGFLAAGRLSSNEEDRALQRNDMLVDIVNATASSVLGLTMACAQCHDHKFDPISQQDYYRWQAFFVGGQINDLELTDAELWRQYEAGKPAEFDPAEKLRETIFAAARERLLREQRAKLTPQQLAAWEKPDAERNADEQELARQASLVLQVLDGQVEARIGGDDKTLYDALKKKLEALRQKMPARPQTWGFHAPATAGAKVNVLPMKGFYPLPFDPQALGAARAYVLKRGDVHARGALATPGWPAVLGETPAAATASKPRSALVDWLVARDNPLTARVWANRVWQYHFGRGIVATPADFGVRGARPTHPELLDWLATQLLEGGWSTKRLHRAILLSSTYRQAAADDPANAKIDPANRFYWRFTPRRLEAESIRDSLLAASGELDRTLGGASLAADALEGQRRRSLYLRQTRDRAPPMQALFDGPNAAETCPRREVSVVALQSLHLLNNDFVYQRAMALAARVMHEAPSDRPQQALLAFRFALGRAPDKAEADEAARFFADAAALPRPKVDAVSAAPAASSAAGPAAANANDSTTAAGATEKPAEPGDPALVEFCHALLNLNELVSLE